MILTQKQNNIDKKKQMTGKYWQISGEEKYHFRRGDGCQTDL
jgi:hypothetical protein